MSKLKLLVASTILLISAGLGCGGADGKDGASCSVEETSEGVKTLVCEDGTSVVISDNQHAPDSHSSLVKIIEEAPGTNCENGGKAIQTGLDTNDNGELDADEVEQTTYVCEAADGADGADGLPTLIEVSDEPLGDSCATGGSRIETGVDANDDGTLDPDEIAQTTYLCEEECPGSMIYSEPGDVCVEPQITIYCVVEDFLNPQGLYPHQISADTPCKIDVVYDPSQAASSDSDGNATYEFSDAPNGIYISVGEDIFYTTPGPNALVIEINDEDASSSSTDGFTITSNSNQMPYDVDESQMGLIFQSSGTDTLSSTALDDLGAASSQFNQVTAVLAGCINTTTDCFNADPDAPDVETWALILAVRDGSFSP